MTYFHRYNFGMTFGKAIRRLILFLLISWLLTNSVIFSENITERARRYTLDIEFDYIAWTIKAASQKAGQFHINPVDHLTGDTQKQIIEKYFELIRNLENTQAKIAVIYSDPDDTTPERTARDFLSLEKELEDAIVSLSPIAESILQHQVSEILEENGFGIFETTQPPVLFQTSSMPKALILSPRSVIQQDVNISLLADLTLEDVARLEKKVEDGLDVSALVVDVGGIGVYPTMIERTSYMRWTIDTIAHEWAHNYLSLHPLGWNYDTSPETRTMNETTASLVGTEISASVMDRFYPELARVETQPKVMKAPIRQAFDFRHEMHLTRVRTDELLAQGLVAEAETYMEERRQIFVANGYMIRKLNQAYFAFHGAYADVPGGAAGEDPVGPAVRKLRSRSSSLADFVKTIAKMDSYEDLKQLVD